MSTLTCPSRDELLAYAAGRLADESSESMAAHLDACPDCQAGLVTLEDAEDTFVAQLRQPAVTDPYLEESECRLAVARARAAMESTGETPAIAPSRSVRGTILGEYELIEELGHGGMGTVYKALHTKLDRVVALKVLTTGRTQDPRAISRFEREFRAIGKLDHHHIVRAYDAREIDGTPVLVMEYIEGLDLAEIVRRLGAVPVSDACEIARQTALGLQYVHEHGLVHRDIKPSNLMLTTLPSPVLGRGAGGEGGNSLHSRSGRGAGGGNVLPSPVLGRGAGGEGASIKILDLGLARFHLDQSPAEETAGTGRTVGGEMTGTDQAMGTADYMAPEQVSNSRAADIRADIYSLGCTLYKLLSGRAPFDDAEHQGAAEKMAAHVGEPVPSIRQVNPAVPADLAAVLDRMLAKSPTARFANPAEVAEALGRFTKDADLAGLVARATSGEPAMTPLSRSGRGAGGEGAKSSRRRIFLALAAGLLLLGGLAWALGVMITIKKDGRETKLNVPAGADVTVADNGDVEVKLPPTLATASHFGPLIEHVISQNDADTQGFVFFSLRSEKLVKPPASLILREIHSGHGKRGDDVAPRLPGSQTLRETTRRNALAEPTPELAEWTAANDVDVLFRLQAQQWDIQPLNLKGGNAVPKAMWDESVASDEIEALFSGGGRRLPVPTFNMPYDDVFHIGYAFETRGGLRGILQCAGLNTTPRSVKIRYKLVQGPNPAAEVSSKPKSLPEKLFATEEQIKRIELFITGKSFTTGYPPPELSDPPRGHEFRLRADVVFLPILPAEKSDLDFVPLGTVFYLPADNVFCIQWDGLGASTLHYYGPFYGDPVRMLGFGGATSLRFGPVIELTVGEWRTQDNMVDLGAGRLLKEKLPLIQGADLEQTRKAEAAFFRSRGVDLLGTGTGLIAVELVAIQVEPSVWEQMSASAVQDEVLERRPSLIEELPRKMPRTLPETYVFRTRKGSMGLLQVTDLLDNPLRVKFRYKLVESGAPGQQLPRTIEVIGTLEPSLQVKLNSKINGEVEKVYVALGDKVKKGQLLAELSAPQIVAELKERTAQEAKAQAEYAAARRREAKALAEYAAAQRRASIANGGDKEAAEAFVKSALSGIAAAKAEKDRVEALCGETKLRAPIDGIVAESNIQLHASVTAASSGSEPPLIRIVSIDPIFVCVAVPEQSAVLVTKGDEAFIRVPSLPGEIFEGKVIATAGIVDPTTGTMSATILAPNPAGRLMPGMFARVTLTLRHSQASMPQRDATGPGSLEFRIAPQPSSLDPAERKSYVDWLQAGRIGLWWKGGRVAGRMPEYAWMPVAESLTNTDQLLTGVYQGKKYVLVSDKPGQTMTPGQGKDAWSLESVTVGKDDRGFPEIHIRLDERGGELFSALSEANIGSPLAMIVDGKAVFAPVLRTALSRDVLITGRFSPQELGALLKALQRKPDGAADSEKPVYGLQAERDITTNDADDQGLVFFRFKNNDVLKPPFPLKLHLHEFHLVELTPELKQWIKANDVDVLFHFGESSWDMMTLEMQEDYAGQPTDWPTIGPDKAVLVLAKKDAEHLVRSEVPASSRGHGYRDGWNYVNAFRTRGNRIGVYQSRGIDDLSGRGVEIRFRLVQPATTAQPAAIADRAKVARAGGKMNADRDVLKAGLQQAEGTKRFGPVIEKVVGYGGDAATDNTPAESPAKEAPAGADGLDSAVRLLQEEVGGSWEKNVHNMLRDGTSILRGRIDSRPGIALVLYDVFPFGPQDPRSKTVLEACQKATGLRVLGTSPKWTVVEDARGPAAAFYSLRIVRALGLKVATPALWQAPTAAPRDLDATVKVLQEQVSGRWLKGAFSGAGVYGDVLRGRINKESGEAAVTYTVFAFGPSDPQMLWILQAYAGSPRVRVLGASSEWIVLQDARDPIADEYSKRLVKALNLSVAAHSITVPKPPAVPDNVLAAQPPVVVETFPVSGARDVAAGETEIRVRFSKQMTDGSWSWSTAWDNSTPEFIGRPHYEADRRTCVAKVKLEAGRTYAFWLNSEKFQNFTDSYGRPAVPYLLIFQTKPK